MNISKYCTLEEAVKSDTAIRKGIDNAPDTNQIKAMQTIALLVYDPLCEKFGKIPFNSFFRSEKLNKAIGGAKTSQHVKGEAIDLDADTMPKLSNAELFKYIRDNMEFSQLIWEYGNDAKPDWVHVSFSSEHNQKEVLRAIKVNGKTKYVKL